MTKIENLTAVIYGQTPDEQQAVFFNMEETYSGKFDVLITTPVTVDTSRRDLDVDIEVALKESGYHEVINQVYTVNNVRP